MKPPKPFNKAQTLAVRMQQTDIYYPTLKHFIVVFPLYIVIRIWQSTVRLVTDEESLKLMSSPARIIGIAWHSRIFFLAMCKYYYRDKFPMAGLVSASKDGAYLAAFFKLMGIGTVRGSSKRRGVGAIMALINALKDGSDVVHIPMSSGLSETALVIKHMAETDPEFMGKVYALDNHRVSITQKQAVTDALKCNLNLSWIARLSFPRGLSLRTSIRCSGG